MTKKIVITGGGTGGHVFPALAIAEELRNRGWEILYVGTPGGMEATLVPERSFRFFTVHTGAVKNQGIFTILRTLFRLIRGTLWSIRFLIKEKPDAILGMGGYVSFPISLAAFFLRYPLFLQEQNASVGISNRLLARLSKKVFLGFEDAKQDLPKGKCLVTGNPLRASFYKNDRKYPDTGHLNLFVMGGSQGARAINDALIGMIPKLLGSFPTLKVLHQTGRSDFERSKEAYRELNDSRVEAKPFISDMVAEYQKASLVISRSGALSVSEIIYFGLPAIFVPYPRRGQNDQTANAALVQRAGAAQIVEQGDAFGERLWAALFECLNPTKLQAMSKAYEEFPKVNSCSLICDLIEKNVQQY